MKWSGISVGKMMLVVATLAADFALFYHLEYLTDIFNVGTLLFVGLLPMVNVIAFGLPRLLRRGRRAPFAIGFQATSWASTFVVLVVFVAKIGDLYDSMSMPWLFGIKVPQPIYGSPVVQPPIGLFESCFKALGNLCEDEEWVRLAVVMVLLSLPPFLFSLAGGLVARSVVRFRSRSAIVSPLPSVVAIDPLA